MTGKAPIVEASVNGSTAEIKICGFIYSWDFADFERKLNEIIELGIEDAYVYLDTIGGDVFVGNAIANAIAKFPGTINGELGALCASCGTYIACAIKKNGGSVSMPANGYFMIHKPSINGFTGNEDEMSARLKLIKGVTADYRKLYAEVTGMTEKEIDKLWASEYYMNAEEALEMGFITEIIGEVEMSEAVTAVLQKEGLITAQLPSNSDTNPNKTIMKDLKIFAAALGLAETAAETEIVAAMNNLKAEAAKVPALQAKLKEIEDKAKEQKAADITAMLDTAVSGGKITAEERPRWQKLAEADLENTKAALDGMSVYKPITATLNSAAPGVGDKYEGWDYGKFASEAPTVLAAMQKEDPERFKQLKADYVKGLKKD